MVLEADVDGGLAVRSHPARFRSNDSGGPYSALGVPLWVYVLGDESTDYLVTYLFLAASIGPFGLPALIGGEIAWLAVHVLLRQRRIGRT